MPRYAILVPVLDDWESLGHLIEDIDRATLALDGALELIILDDGSTNGPPRWTELPAAGCSRLERIEILRLALNLGHQRAIAVGLSALAGRADLDGVIVMDGDGEDRPDDIPRLIEAASRTPGNVIVARRARRSEGILFRFGYALYKAQFRAMTGKTICFGNFSVLPMQAVRRLVHMPELWNNLPASIVRSRLAYRAIDTIRGRRYAGASRMNLPALIVHGLSAMAVYADVMFVRVVLGAASVAGATLLAMAAVVAIRLLTDLAIPGWATSTFGNLLIVLFQALVIVVATTFMVLASRTARPFVPIADTAVYIAERTVLTEARQPEPVDA
jgi:polyisoprenyl-phosphate glycosyltransferase